MLYCIDTNKLYIHSCEVNLMNLWNKVCHAEDPLTAPHNLTPPDIFVWDYFKDAI